jgi:hypothetical protein
VSVGFELSDGLPPPTCKTWILIDDLTLLQKPGNITCHRVGPLGYSEPGLRYGELWLTIESLGVCVQKLSLSARKAWRKVKRILGVPEEMKIAYAVRLGYPIHAPGKYLRVRRDAEMMTHHNRYETHPELQSPSINLPAQEL